MRVPSPNQRYLKGPKLAHAVIRQLQIADLVPVHNLQ